MGPKSCGYSNVQKRFIEANPWVHGSQGEHISLKRMLGGNISIHDPRVQKLIPPTFETEPDRSPAVPFSRWLAVRDAHLHGRLDPSNTSGQAMFEKFTRDDCFDLKEKMNSGAREWGEKVLKRGKFAQLLLAAGTGGRLFGYDVPEEERIKVLYKLGFQGGSVSPLEIRMRHAVWAEREFGAPVRTDVCAGEESRKGIALAADRLFKGKIPANFRFWSKFGMPRWIPTKGQILRSNKFREQMKKQGIIDEAGLERNAEEIISESGNSGDLFFDCEGRLSTKPLGQLMTLTTAAINGTLASWLRSGIEVVMVSNGEDMGSVIDPARIGAFELSGADMMCILTDSAPGGGGPVFRDGKPILMEKEVIPKSTREQMSLKNTNTMYLKVSSLPMMLCGMFPHRFLRASASYILSAMNHRIYSRIPPLPEVKPVPVKFEVREGRRIATTTWYAGQASWVMGHLTHLDSVYVFARMAASKCLLELKEPEDIPMVEEGIDRLYSGKVVAI